MLTVIRRLLLEKREEANQLLIKGDALLNPSLYPLYLGKYQGLQEAINIVNGLIKKGEDNGST